MVTHEVDDEVVRSGHDDDSREGTGEIVWVVGNRLVLCFLELGSELVEGVSVGAVIDSDIEHLCETGDVEGVGISVVGVSVAASDGRVTLVVVVGEGETLSSAEEAALKESA